MEGHNNPPPRRVLVVDDNRDSADSLAMVLGIYGHDARPAYDGTEALALAESFEPEVVLLDIGLPDIDGREVCRRLRALPRGAAMLIVAQTGWSSETDQASTREAGFDHHAVKPVDPDSVLGWMSREPLRQPA